MRTNLAVPFAEKDAAKKLGARWDASRKVWYVEGSDKLDAFRQWLPGAQPAPVGTKGKPASTPRSTQSKPGSAAPAGEIRIGASYFVLACDCLPWEGCAKCHPVVATAKWGAKG